MNQIVNPQVTGANPWVCVLSIMCDGALGGLLNANMSDNGFALPTRIKGIWCPGALWNVFVGAMSAVTSWALYGSGSVIEVAGTQREQISLKLGALAGALIVGMAGSKWLTSEVDKSLMKQSVREVARHSLSPQECDGLEDCGSPRSILKAVAGSQSPETTVQ
jgi:hypothetical protein